MPTPFTPDPKVITSIQVSVAEFLSRLTKSKIYNPSMPYIIVGGAALYLQGYADTFNDVDLIIIGLDQKFDGKRDIIGRGDQDFQDGLGVIVQMHRSGDYIADGFSELQKNNAVTLYDLPVQIPEHSLQALLKTNRAKDQSKIEFLKPHFPNKK